MDAHPAVRKVASEVLNLNYLNFPADSDALSWMIRSSMTYPGNHLLEYMLSADAAWRVKNGRQHSIFPLIRDSRIGETERVALLSGAVDASREMQFRQNSYGEDLDDEITDLRTILVPHLERAVLEGPSHPKMQEIGLRSLVEFNFSSKIRK